MTAAVRAAGVRGRRVGSSTALVGSAVAAVVVLVVACSTSVDVYVENQCEFEVVARDGLTPENARAAPESRVTAIAPGGVEFTVADLAGTSHSFLLQSAHNAEGIFVEFQGADVQHDTPEPGASTVTISQDLCSQLDGTS